MQKALLGFASGVMIAASVWSLLVPAIDQSEGLGRFAFMPAAVGLLLGIGFLLVLDKSVPICIWMPRSRRAENRER